MTPSPRTKRSPRSAAARGSSASDAMASVRPLRLLAAALLKREHDVAKVFKRAGIDPARLFDLDAKLPFSAVLAAWRSAEELARAPDIGLEAAAIVDFRVITHSVAPSEHVLLRLLATSATLGEGLARLVRFFPLTYGPARLVLDEGREASALRLLLPPGPVPRSFVDATLGWIIRAAYGWLTEARAPIEVRLAYPAPASDLFHRRVLGAPVRFGARDNAIVIARADLHERMVGAERTEIRRIEARAEAELAESVRGVPLTDQVRAIVAAELTSGDRGAERTARALGLSVRTLSRRLSALGSSHHGLLDEVRRQETRRLLAAGDTPAAEMAKRLGFSHASAFRRWLAALSPPLDSDD